MEWSDVLSDKEKFPDGTKIKIGTDEIEVGAMRRQLGLQSEFTKHTQQLSAESKQLKDALGQHQQALLQRDAQLHELRQAQQEMARTMQALRQPQAVAVDDLQDYRSGFDPLVKRIEKLQDDFTQTQSMMDRQAKVIEALQNRIHQDETAINAWRYSMQMNDLKKQDETLDPTALAEFATRHYSSGVDVGAAYKLMTYDHTMKRIAEDAEKRGYDRAKAEPVPPPMPGGVRRKPAAAAVIDLPKNLDQRVELAASDPDIVNGLEQGLAELNGSA